MIVRSSDHRPSIREMPPPGVTVPFNMPAYLGMELDEVHNAIVNNRHISGVGPYTRQCEAFLSELYQKPVLLVGSCTHALEIAAHLLELGPEDEVILPSYTFVSTANAFALRSCRLVFAECDGYGQMSLESVKRQITERTKAICVVYYAGHATPDLEALTALCQERGIFLVEDAAQAIGAEHNGRLLGTWGDLACLSFHETKNVTAGEGGALIVNTSRFLERAYHLREKGTNRAQFFQGLVDKYTWVDVSSSYVLSDMNAAYLWVQLQHLQTIQAKRHELLAEYKQALPNLLERLKAQILAVPPKTRSNAHLFALIFEEGTRREAFIRFMKERGIITPFHYVALHSSPVGQRYPTTEDFSTTHRLSEGLVRLPLFYNMEAWQQAYVLEAIQDFSSQD